VSGIDKNRRDKRGSYKAHYVSVGPQEHRCVSKGPVGEVEGGTEEGRLEGGLARPIKTILGEGRRADVGH